MSEAYNNHSIDTELQVRLMNLVMGEASDFERDQLQLMMEQRPELVVYYQHIEHLHGLLCEVGTGESAADSDPTIADAAWQLSSERREKVLAVLDNRSLDLTDKVTLADKGIVGRWRVSAVQAVVAASVACVLIGLLWPATYAYRQSARSFSIKPDVTGGTNRWYYWNDSLDKSSTTAVVPLARPMGPRATNSEPASGNGSPNVLFAQPNSTVLLSDGSVDSFGTSGDFAASAPRGYSGGMGGGMGYRGGIMGGGGMGGRPGQPNVQFQKLDDLSSVAVAEEAAIPMDDRRPMSFPSSSDWRELSMARRKTQASLGQPNEKGAASEMDKVATGLSGAVAESHFGNDKTGRPGISAELRFQNLPGKKPSESGPRGSSVGSDNNVPSFMSEPSDGRFGGGKEDSKPADQSVAIGKSAATGKSGLENWENKQDHDLDFFLTDAIELKSSAMSSTVDSELGVRENSISLGGIGLTRDEGGKSLSFSDMNGIDQSSALMQTVTPPIIIPEEEQVLADLSKDQVRVNPGDGESSELQRKAMGEDFVGKSEQVDPNTVSSNKSHASKPSDDGVWARDSQRLSRNGDKTPDASKSQMGRIETTDFESAERRLKYLDVFNNQSENWARPNIQLDAGIVSEKDFKENNLGWKVAPAPSPEIANGREKQMKMFLKVEPAKPPQPISIDEQSASVQSFSTFSLHASDVSFKLAQTALGQGQWPNASKIRIEEFVNALDYHDPLPSGNQKIACRVEQAIHPFLMQRNLLRVSMRTAASGRSQNTPLRLTLVLDSSGSMERPDRRQAVLRAFQMLVQQLSAADQVTLISFASTPRLLADKVAGNQAAMLLQLIENLPSEGGTNIEAAMLLAREKAVEQQLAGAQNRIVMLTDGAVNLGNANPESLAKLVTQMRDAGIAFDAAGISAQDLNDEVLEALTRQGDGRYYLLDSAAAVGDSFAAQIAGALRPSAQNVKVQVEFNPQRVGRYKLLGFEKHRLNKEDFRNDQVDAAEMAAAEAGVAVYQFEIKPNGSGDVGSVSVRFRDLSSGQMVERRWPILYESNTPRIEQAQASMQLAASAALFATKLGGGPLADNVDLAQLQNLLTTLPEQISNQPRVQQLRAMIDQAKTIGAP